MPRIAEARPAAEPSSPGQKARYRRMLTTAARLAAEHGLERVQMHEVAKDAEVAIGTLYRYFPSKTHLFTAVTADQVERLDEQTPTPEPGNDRTAAAAEVLITATRYMLAQPALAIAMMQSSNAAQAATVTDVARIDSTFTSLMLRVLGIEQPRSRDTRLVRLLLQCWYGMLTASVNGRLSMLDLETDIRLACQLLAPRTTAATSQ